MKIYSILVALTILLSACTDIKQQQKDALEEVLKVHDEAMIKTGQAMKNKILLDSLIKTKAVDSAKAAVVLTDLSAADKAMEDWMHAFNADNEGKSHEEIMRYLAGEKKKVNEVNNRLNKAVSQSNQFLSTIKK
jgi:enamine deaminase RidA (YjgF/YER057c/UK114 family)